MTTDTIAAIATAPGAGGIGIVRVSGPGALPILEKLFAPAGKGGYKPWILRRGRVQDTEGNTLDDSLAVFMPGPKTFTGEDVAEFQCHGGPVLLAAVLEACLCAGARLAERGEFTRRRLPQRQDGSDAGRSRRRNDRRAVQGRREACSRQTGRRARAAHRRSAGTCGASAGADLPCRGLPRGRSGMPAAGRLPLRHRGREDGGGLPARRIRADPLLARRA